MIETQAKVILVDENDQPIGVAEKLSAHQNGGQLHRAFSIFILRKVGQDYELLLQKRQFHKYHSGGLWTNSCCSHPYPNEDIIAAGRRRLHEELGFDCPLTDIAAFIYKAKLDNDLTEHEFDHVLVGFHDQDSPNVNPEEVAETRWITLDKLQREQQQKPEFFTAWFGEALENLVSHLPTIEKLHQRSIDR